MTKSFVGTFVVTGEYSSVRVTFRAPGSSESTATLGTINPGTVQWNDRTYKWNGNLANDLRGGKYTIHPHKAYSNKIVKFVISGATDSTRLHVLYEMSGSARSGGYNTILTTADGWGPQANAGESSAGVGDIAVDRRKTRNVCSTAIAGSDDGSTSGDGDGTVATPSVTLEPCNGDPIDVELPQMIAPFVGQFAVSAAGVGSSLSISGLAEAIPLDGTVENDARLWDGTSHTFQSVSAPDWQMASYSPHIPYGVTSALWHDKVVTMHISDASFQSYVLVVYDKRYARDGGYGALLAQEGWDIETIASPVWTNADFPSLATAARRVCRRALPCELRRAEDDLAVTPLQEGLPRIADLAFLLDAGTPQIVNHLDPNGIIGLEQCWRDRLGSSNGAGLYGTPNPVAVSHGSASFEALRFDSADSACFTVAFDDNMTCSVVERYWTASHRQRGLHAPGAGVALGHAGGHVYVGLDDGTADPVAKSSSASPVGEWTLITTRISRGANRTEVWIDGRRASVRPSAALPPLGILAVNSCPESGEAPTTTNSNIDLAAVVCYATVLSDREVESLNKHMSETFGIPLRKSSRSPWTSIGEARLSGNSRMFSIPGDGWVAQASVFPAFVRRWKLSLVSGQLTCNTGLAGSSASSVGWMAEATCPPTANVEVGLALDVDETAVVGAPGDPLRRLRGCGVLRSASGELMCDAPFPLSNESVVGPMISVNWMAATAPTASPKSGGSAAVEVFAWIEAAGSARVLVNWAVDTEELYDTVLGPPPPAWLRDTSGNDINADFIASPDDVQAVTWQRGLVSFLPGAQAAATEPLPPLVSGENTIVVAAWAGLPARTTQDCGLLCTLVGVAPVAINSQLAWNSALVIGSAGMDDDSATVAVHLGGCVLQTDLVLSVGRRWHHIAAAARVDMPSQPVTTAGAVRVWIDGEEASIVAAAGDYCSAGISIDSASTFAHAGGVTALADMGATSWPGMLGDVQVSACDADSVYDDIIDGHRRSGLYNPLLYARPVAEPRVPGEWVSLLQSAIIAGDALVPAKADSSAAGLVATRIVARLVDGQLACGTANPAEHSPWQSCHSDVSFPRFTFELLQGDVLRTPTLAGVPEAMLPYECRTPSVNEVSGDIYCDVSFPIRAGKSTFTLAWPGSRPDSGVAPGSGSLTVNVDAWCTDEAPLIWWRRGLLHRNSSRGGNSMQRIIGNDGASEYDAVVFRGGAMVHEGGAWLTAPGSQVTTRPLPGRAQLRTPGGTLMAWVYLASTTNGVTAIISIGGIAIEAVTTLDASAAEVATLQCRVGDGLLRTPPTAMPEPNSWFHVTVSFTAPTVVGYLGPEDIHMYIDGTLVPTEEVGPVETVWPGASAGRAAGDFPSFVTLGRVEDRQGLVGGVSEVIVIERHIGAERVNVWMQRGLRTGVTRVTPPGSAAKAQASAGPEDAVNDGTSSDRALTSCVDAPIAGVWWVNDGFGLPVQVYCDSDGWMLLHKSVEGQTGIAGQHTSGNGGISLSDVSHEEVVTPVNDSLQLSARFAGRAFDALARRPAIEWRRQVALFSAEFPSKPLHTQSHRLELSPGLTFAGLVAGSAGAENITEDLTCMPLDGTVRVFWESDVIDAADWQRVASGGLVAETAHVTWHNGPALALLGCGDGARDPIRAASQAVGVSPTGDLPNNAAVLVGTGTLSPTRVPALSLAAPAADDRLYTRPCLYACRGYKYSLGPRKAVFEVTVLSARPVQPPPAATDQDVAGDSCDAIFASVSANEGSEPDDGPYWLSSGGSTLADSATGSWVRAQCETGGWTVAFRRLSQDAVDHPLSFCRPFGDYASGFGAVESSYWVGLQYLASLTALAPRGLEAELIRGGTRPDGSTFTRTVRYGRFGVGPASTGFQLSVGDMQRVTDTDSTPDAFSALDGQPFIAYDQSQGGSSLDCASDSWGGGGFWRSSAVGNFNPTGIGKAASNALRSYPDSALTVDDLSSGGNPAALAIVGEWTLRVRRRPLGSPDDGDAVIAGTYEQPAGRSCFDVLQRNPSLAGSSGVYMIAPAGALAPVLAWCDMEVDGGGYTALLMRSEAAEAEPLSPSYAQPFQEYWRGFGRPGKSAWLGLQYLHALSSCSVALDMIVRRVHGSGTLVEAVYSGATFELSSDGSAIATIPASDGDIDVFSGVNKGVFAAFNGRNGTEGFWSGSSWLPTASWGSEALGHDVASVSILVRHAVTAPNSGAVNDDGGVDESGTCDDAPLRQSAQMDLDASYAGHYMMTTIVDPKSGMRFGTIPATPASTSAEGYKVWDMKQMYMEWSSAGTSVNIPNEYTCVPCIV